MLAKQRASASIYRGEPAICSHPGFLQIKEKRQSNLGQPQLIASWLSNGDLSSASADLQPANVRCRRRKMHPSCFLGFRGTPHENLAGHESDARASIMDFASLQGKGLSRGWECQCCVTQPKLLLTDRHVVVRCLDA